METYRILGGLHRHGIAGDDELELIMPKDDQDD